MLTLGFVKGTHGYVKRLVMTIVNFFTVLVNIYIKNI